MADAVDLAAAVAEYQAAQQAVADGKAAVRAGQDRLRRARAVLTEAIVADAHRGKRMRDLVATTGFSREWLRTLLRQHGVEADD
jgi:hypothetical protein